MGIANYANPVINEKNSDLKRERYKTYPPYVLIFGNSNSEGSRLKRRLERNGCQVSRIESISDGLNIAGQQSFDLVVFNLQNQENEDKLEETYEKLSNDPKLTNTPIVIITNQEYTRSCANESKAAASVYYLSKENSSEVNLLQIAQHSQYMSYRYM